MKKISISIIAIITIIACNVPACHAQVVNWGNISGQNKHLLHLNTGLDYGFVAGIGYHQIFREKSFPFILGLDFSMPFGKGMDDELKLKAGGEIRLLKVSRFQTAVRMQVISRRYENSLVRLFNFGGDFAATLGYYRKHWFLGAELGFDKAIVTHFKHSQLYKDNIYHDVQDGWYEPATAGNFYYGGRAGISLRKIDVTVKAGKIIQEDFKSAPLIPFYSIVGVNLRL